MQKKIPDPVFGATLIDTDGGNSLVLYFIGIGRNFTKSMGTVKSGIDPSPTVNKIKQMAANWGRGSQQTALDGANNRCQRWTGVLTTEKESCLCAMTSQQ